MLIDCSTIPGTLLGTVSTMANSTSTVPAPMKFKMSMLWGFSKNSVQNICIAHKMWISFSFLNFESIVLDMHGIYIHCNLKCECVLLVCMCMFSCANTHVHGHTVTHPLNSLTLIYFIWRHFPVEPLSQASLICLEWLTCEQSRVDVWIESLSQVPLEDSIGSMVSHLASCSWFSVEGHDKQWTLFFCCSDVLIKMNSWNIVFWVQSQVLSWDNKISKKKNFHHVFLGHVSYTCFPRSHGILFWGCYVSHISMYVLFNPLIQETLPCVFHAWYSQNNQKCAVNLNVLFWYSFPQICLITKFSWVPP